MNGKTVGDVHWSFWVIGVVALIWNVMGVMNFFVQMNADMVAAMPETHRAIIDSRPMWATGDVSDLVFEAGREQGLDQLVTKRAHTRNVSWSRHGAGISA